MSSSGDNEPSNVSQEDFQSGQYHANQTAIDHPVLENEQPLNKLPAGEPAIGTDPLPTDNEFDIGENLLRLREYVENEDDFATLQFNEQGRLSPALTHPHGNLFEDHPSAIEWRQRTASERAVEASLEQARASDLSIHLFDAFKLNRGARAQIPDENGFIETKAPPKNWTAWPLPPAIVPREHETKKFENEDDDWRAGPYVMTERKPGDELRELLTARAMKTAKERFEARDSEVSQQDYEEVEYQRPVVMADDGVAAKMLQPSIQHLMGNLDSLLMGLHHARSSYLSKEKFKTRKSARKSGPSSAQGTIATKKRSKSFIRRSRSSEGSSDSDVEASEPEDSTLLKKQQNDTASTSRGNGGDGFLKRKAQLGLRDWSDVLGVASMVGIDSVVINRSASRCTELLGEGMSFRTLHEGPYEDKETVCLPFGSISIAVDGSKGPGNEADMYGGVHVDGFLERIEGRKSWKYPVKLRKRSVTGSNDELSTET